jgi:hypothetical protein
MYQLIRVDVLAVSRSGTREVERAGVPGAFRDKGKLLTGPACLIIGQSSVVHVILL